MYRGSAFLLQRSVKFLAPLVNYISRADPALWDIDAQCYTPANIQRLREQKRDIYNVLGIENDASDTLTSKIMLGVFGNVPAFDNNFKHGFHVATFGPKALEKIGRYYEANQAIIERYRIPTLDFATGQPSGPRYTRAKVIDMIFFIEGGAGPGD